MRRNVLASIAVLSLTGLTAVIGACATAPVDDGFFGVRQDQKPAEPEEKSSAKIPPPSNPSTPVDAGTDAATTKDSGTTTPKDSGTTTPADSGPPPSVDCDPNDMTYYFEFIAPGSPSACPCGAGQCCYLSLGCVAK
jgi:hypothetical protein